ncbi:hypothetical protein [Streptomyces sp. NPDC020965]|uniref:hypothetical protein n=1 Tax=Streptomyces sp. NPDC020965 TaxID=3365105 RepID=UPI0037B74EB6
MLDEAAEAVGFARDGWDTQAAGDSELAVLPVGESEPLLVDDFMRHLEAALRGLNDGREPSARLRLRAAVHHGTAVRAVSGFSGPGPVEVSRILDSAPLKRALLRSPGACLALAVSREVFNTVVAEEFTTLRTEEFREVRVVSKEFDDTVWITVPGGGDIWGLDLASEPRTNGASRRGGHDGASGHDGHTDHAATDRGGPIDHDGPPDRDRTGEPATGAAGQRALQVFEAPIAGSVIGIANIHGR